MSAGDKPPGGAGARFPLPLERLGRAARKGTEPLRPQRPLHEAARDAARQAAWQATAAVRGADPGLDAAPQRQRMVQRLRAEGIRCEPVFEAMVQVPRHPFIDPGLAVQAYEDTSLPIGHGQTISKPSVVARMIELLFDATGARSRGHLGRVLEVGTGCGYQTALLARLGSRVVSIERIQALHDKARENLAPLALRAVQLVHGDGMRGHPAGGPYDSLIAAAGGDELPEAWLQQLAIGGRLVAPMRHPEGRGQVLVVVERHAQGLRRSEHEGVLFVPLKSGVA